MEKFQYQRPQISLARPTGSRMWLVSACALLAVIQSSLGDSFSSLGVAAGCVAGAVLTELLVLRKAGSLKDGSAVASAMVLALFLPNQISPLYAALGAVFATAVVKHSFGGLGSNWLNPAAAGWLFIRLSWPGAFGEALEGSTLSLLAESLARGISSPEGSPLGILKIDSAGLFAAGTAADGAVSSFFNYTILWLTGAEIPGGYFDLLAPRFPGIIAERGGFALLIGTLVLSASQVNRSWIPAVYLGVFGFFVRMAGALPYGGGFWNGDVLFGLFTGGTLAAAFFLAADPATGAKSNRGILFSTAIGGITAFLFRYCGNEPYGVIAAVLCGNAMLQAVRVLERSRLFEKETAKTSSAGTTRYDASPGRYL